MAYLNTLGTLTRFKWSDLVHFFLPSIMVAYLVSLFLAVMFVQVCASTLLSALAAESFSVCEWYMGLGGVDDELVEEVLGGG